VIVALGVQSRGKPRCRKKLLTRLGTRTTLDCLRCHDRAFEKEATRKNKDLVLELINYIASFGHVSHSITIICAMTTFKKHPCGLHMG
jgi:hypothetical protein